MEVALDGDQEEIKKTALALPNVQRMIEDKQIRKIIVVPNKLVNIVI